MDPAHDAEFEKLHQVLMKQIKTLFQIEDTSGVEIFSLINRLAHLSKMHDNQPDDEKELSGPRWKLMLHLFSQEQLGNADGLTPTVLSQSQRVSKNTISALLRGLEEQGLIQRNLDTADLRIFRIQLSQAGRELMIKTAPRRIEAFNHMLEGLDPGEKQQLIALLEKLHRSLLAHCHQEALRKS
jgi:DNA-binding MarR family transcriptional regulator